MVDDVDLINSGINPQRVTVVSEYDGSAKGRFVLYWMQASVRCQSNAALEYAVMVANELGLPVVACFVLTGGYPGANSRHYDFLAQGLGDVRAALTRRGIQFVVRVGEPPLEILELSKDAAFVVTDCGYLKLQRQWRQQVYNGLRRAAVEVEDNVVVPVEIASDKEEYGARTIRPKITRNIERFLVPVKTVKHTKKVPELKLGGIDISRLDNAVARLGSEYVCGSSFIGGENAAQLKLDDFLKHNLSRYDQSNDPTVDVTSRLSPYLHFGMISPVDIALKAKAAGECGEFLEQLIVRRELAINFVYYNPDYKSYDLAVPQWAKKTLEEHRRDKREYLYGQSELENAGTHDPAWNAAQKQMAEGGYMAGYMRMYWGKKVIEWSRSPQEAFETLIYLNDKYELDGRDSNGYCGIAWCFGKHDRPWAKRPIFGTIRYMNYAGLKRKFDIEAYCRENSKRI